MLLTFERTYRSIARTPTTDDMPKFVVITGTNGAGKSQLLEAIENGSLAVYSEGVNVASTEVRRVSNEELTAALATPPVFEPGSKRTQLLESIRAWLGQANSEGLYGDAVANRLYQVLETSQYLTRSGAEALEKRTKKRLADWEQSDLLMVQESEIGTPDPFRLEVQRVFTDYRRVHTENEFQAFLNARQPGSAPEHLSDENFVETYGPAPWTMINSLLDRLGLGYHFDAPPIDISGVSSRPVLRDFPTGRIVDTETLSAGERILLNIALSLYSAGERSTYTQIPRVVLFDEPDSGLHPTMVQNLMDLLTEVLVNQMQLIVMMTTHSPTTVALAPEGSLFTMHREGTERLRRAKSRDDALSDLLVGVPLLSVKIENRRLVLVEDKSDAAIYTEAFRVVRSLFQSPRSLQFLQVGKTKGEDGGCAKVIDYVHHFYHEADLPVFGLIDRDNRVDRPSANVIFDATRFAIENLVMDPLSLSLLLLREPEGELQKLLPAVNYLSVHEDTDGQDLVNAVTRLVRPSWSGKSMLVAYGGLFSLEVPSFWLDTRGHDLEEEVITAIPSLNKYARRSPSKLHEMLVGTIWAERPGVVPQSFLDILTELLE